jgi:PucR-like helix-turn-helix protein
MASPSHTSSLILRLAAALREQTGEIAEASVRRLRQELPDYYSVSDPDWQAAGYGALPAALSTAWTTLENDGRVPAHLPSNLVDEALNAARSGVAWEIVDRSYSLTHAAIWDAVLEEVLSWHVPRGDQKLTLSISSSFLFRCFDWLTTAAGDVYASERDDWLDRRQKRLAEMVTQAIEGLAVPDAELGYRTNQHHIGIVGWGHEPQRAITDGARLLDAEILSVPSTGSAVWAWIGRPGFADYEQALSAFSPPPGTHIALGAIEMGRRGFSTTHYQAQLASSVGVRQLVGCARGVIAYPNVAVEAFALSDEPRARVFVAHVLGQLATSDPKSMRLLQTLRAYCDAGGNGALTAQRLGIAERTVRYRLRAIESQFGLALDSRVLELGLAARLFQALEGQAHIRLATVIEAERELEATAGRGTG